MKPLIKASSALVLSLVLAGCNNEQAATSGSAQAAADVEKVVVGSNSPDVTVKSWWALKDAGLRLEDELCKEGQKSWVGVDKRLRALAGDEVDTSYRCLSKSPTYSRKIDSVDVQSETRAVVLATIKNTSPPDDRASTDSAEAAGKEKGSEFRYLLERKDSSSSWAITQVESRAFYSRSWEPELQRPRPSNQIYVDSGAQ